MYVLFVGLALALAGTPHATAAPAKPDRPVLPAYTGPEHCRIAQLQPAPNRDGVYWNGPCEAGFATGNGELEWRDGEGKRYRIKGTLARGEVQGEADMKTEAFTYIGTFRNGVPHGAGFFTFKSGNMYEGGVADGEQEGKGIFVWTNRTEYTGEWKGGKRHGWGEIKYGLGGSYSGQWENDRWHGTGRLTYASSGRVVEGSFEDGRIAGTAPLDTAPARAAIQPRGERKPKLISYMPFDDPWDRLTEAQRNVVRTNYPALDPGDDPPYPAQGMKDVFEAIVKGNSEAGSAEGNLTIYVLVGSDGRAKEAYVYDKPTLDDPENVDQLVKYVAGLLMLKPYRPAMCQGKPCEMMYPLKFSFSTYSNYSPPMFR